MIAWGKRYLPDIGTPPPGGFHSPTAENGTKAPFPFSIL
jgi:hypothetical protein